MFENYINKYLSLLDFESTQDEVNLNDLLNSRKFSKPVKRFISSEINRIVSPNIDDLRNQSLFDQSNGDLLRLFNRLENELKSSVVLLSFEYEKFIKNVIEIRFNFLCRPLTTISKLAFNNSNEVSVVEIQNQLEFFNEYHYLTEGLSEWYENNLEKSFLTKNDFDNIIKEIDDDFIYNLSQEEFVNLLEPIFEVFSFDGLIEEVSQEIPIESLIIFFSEKGITPILNELEDLFNNDKLVISKSDIFDMISRLMSNDDSIELNDDIEPLETEYSDDLNFNLDSLDDADKNVLADLSDDIEPLETEYSDDLDFNLDSLDADDDDVLADLNDDIEPLETEYSDDLNFNLDSLDANDEDVLADLSDDVEPLETEYSDDLDFNLDSLDADDDDVLADLNDDIEPLETEHSDDLNFNLDSLDADDDDVLADLDDDIEPLETEYSDDLDFNLDSLDDVDESELTELSDDVEPLETEYSNDFDLEDLDDNEVNINIDSDEENSNEDDLDFNNFDNSETNDELD
jgi:hypothetical protein